MRTQAYIVEIAKELDITSAILYNQLLFWSDKGQREDGWVYKTYEELEGELGITGYQIRKAYTKLEKSGYIETSVKQVSGATVKHFRILRNCISGSEETAFPYTIQKTTNNKAKAKETNTKKQLEEIMSLINPKEKLTQVRLRLMNGLLKDYSYDEIKTSAVAFSKSEWHMENKQMSVDNLLRPSKFGRWYQISLDGDPHEKEYIPPEDMR